jgi:superfamily II RNA helicase
MLQKNNIYQNHLNIYLHIIIITMVKICPNSYSETKYSSYFEKYPFPLSSFQKYAIEAIVTGNHILVTAHTGSGKTLPAEFAIEHFVSLGKKVIYTSPIKALSNQKFYECTQKFPHISFGILTGDIKTNPEADVLIMTTEILMNNLYVSASKDKSNKSSNLNMFEMDFQNELACVVFDEIHYINDADRGRVWEETIMMLPPHIQMVMLSATLDSPEKFALWCETRGDTIDINNPKIINKMVYLTTTYERVVPLTHYSFITCTQGLFKVLKDKQLENEIMKTINTLHVIQDSRGNFNETNYQTIYKTIKLFHDKNHNVKRQHILNSVAKYMVHNNMLPAICFVLSRKALEQCAKEITTSLLEDDSKVSYIIRRECEQIIRKLPNYQEYLHLPEYNFMVSLLEKGVAIHHAGIMPILREMVELLFAKGYIKLLFATETFAVGINMPTKTVLFTDLNKFDGSGMRPLYSHEYTQMAGRAGRRGIDTIGHVIHLSNLFKDIDQVTLKTMMKGKPQTLVSKFKISYNLLLNLIDIGETDYTKYAKRSMIQNDIEQTMGQYYKSITDIQLEMDNLSIIINKSKIPLKVTEEYIQLKQNRLLAVNKKRKEIDRNIQQIQDEYKTIENDVYNVSKYLNKRNEMDELNNLLNNAQKTLDNNVNNVLHLLEDNQFIIREPKVKKQSLPLRAGKPLDLASLEQEQQEQQEQQQEEQEEQEKYKLTIKGHIASQIREVPCLIFADFIYNKKIYGFETKELVGILSCFTNITVTEDKRTLMPKCKYSNCNNILYELQKICSKFSEIEKDINTGTDYSIHFDLVDYAIKWCECESDTDCKELLQLMSLEKDIFLGEFVKAILKINNITAELEKVAELLGDMSFLSILKQVPQLTLKYVATNQSLYI